MVVLCAAKHLAQFVHVLWVRCQHQYQLLELHISKYYLNNTHKHPFFYVKREDNVSLFIIFPRMCCCRCPYTSAADIYLSVFKLESELDKLCDDTIF